MGNPGRWGALAAGTVIALGFAGCRQEGEQRQQPEGGVAGQVEAAQRQAQEAFEKAQRAQQQAGEQQQAAQRAQTDQEKAAQQAQEAEQRAQTEQQKAQQAQQQAEQQARQAQQQASQAQQQASRAMQQEQMERQQQAQAQRQPSPGAGAMAGGATTQPQQQTPTQTVSGQLVEASPNEIRVGPATGNEIRLQVNPNTQVTQNGQTASVSDLQPGSQVRASYNVQQGQAVATRIEATSPSPGTTGQQRPSGTMGGQQQQPSGTMGGQQQQPSGTTQQPSPGGTRNTSPQPSGTSDY